MTRPVIALTTDFGEIDAYVAIMKGVILGICPDVRLVDVTHQVRPQAIAQAAYLLSTAISYFPDDTIHLVVIDPGVGTSRRPVAVQTARAIYVAPDNGVLAIALTLDPPLKAVEISTTHIHLPRVSATFHGRDIFAPAAAHLACGRPVQDLGREIEPATLIQVARTQVQLHGPGPWHAEVVHVDHFGNAITNVDLEEHSMPRGQIAVQMGHRRLAGLHRTFGDVAVGEPVIYRGSSGRMEIGVRGGSAADELGLKVGDTFLVVQDEQTKGAE